MELVKGLPITEFCDQGQFTPRQRLGLFVHVCQAVQHAHQKGIIHRDIKPSNVLVTLQDGTPLVKVIDFGIAKALGQSLTDKTVFTGFAQMLGTPLYMSPEQAAMSNGDVDTRSDIYALGVLLYELLTGTTPFDRERLRTVSFDEIRRIIREEEPAPPSTRISTLSQAATTVSTQRQSDPRRLRQLIRGELDWIVMKALEKDRNRRYESASAFAADVQHYLNDEPVLACPPSAWYRVRKFARRHRTGLAAACLVLLCLVLLGGGAGWVARDRAVREGALQAQVRAALEEAELRLDSRNWPEAAAAVERAEKLLLAAGYQELPQQLVALRADVRMSRRLEEIYKRPREEEFFTGKEQDTAYAKAFAVYDIDVTALPPGEAAERMRGRRIRVELARALDYWSSMRLRARSQQRPDWKALLDLASAVDLDPWRNRLRGALKSRDRKALEAIAMPADIRRLGPETLHLWGLALYQVGSGDRAMAMLRRAQELFPGDLWLNAELAWFCTRTRPPRYDDALRFHSAALAVRPNNPYLGKEVGWDLVKKKEFASGIAMLSKAIELKPDYADAWVYRAMAQGEQYDYDAAFADIEQALAIKADYAWAWYVRGNFNSELGRRETALADFSKAIALQPRYAEAWCNRGNVQFNLNRYDQALLDYSRAIELKPDCQEAWTGRGVTYMQRKRYDEARKEFDKAVHLRPDDALAWYNRGNAYLWHGKYDKAVADYNEGIKLKDDHPLLWNNRAFANSKLGRQQKAVADFSAAIKFQPDLALAWLGRAGCRILLRQFDGALADSSKAIELDSASAKAWFNRAGAYKGLGQYEQSITDYLKVLELKPDPADLASAYRMLALLLADCPDLRLRNPARAIEYAKKAIAMDQRDGNNWYALGVAHYRAGGWKPALEALEKSRKLRGGNSFDWFFLAMANWQLGQKDVARKWYTLAKQAMDKYLPNHPELRRYRAEIEALLQGDANDKQD
jgi:tetratricopeptide (TPR) repeat protein